ncbi:cytochrome D1 domain-containing protein [Aestuariirhabdus haliotis]|uniref:cytochrome D1 domain-containing protein n=1 Tax=Aestuariirhabdus haliotis TaxID=2918751 RepID=UPI0029E7E346|nr:cytochrome D1 domain-containing protein [Aestuariirhabdus haliotis]
MNHKALLLAALTTVLGACSSFSPEPLRATGDMGVIIERATGSVQIINTSDKAPIGQVNDLGDLSHASIVFSRDERFAYVFGRDGGLSKIDMLTQSIDQRIIQSGNSIGGAISQDGSLVAVSNYSPGGVKVFDSETLELVADIPASQVFDPRSKAKKGSKVVGLVDAPGQKFVFSLFDSDEIWIADFSAGKEQAPKLTKFDQVGRQPYDALISSDGRYYIAGLFGEDGMALVDLWHPEKGSKKILPNYGKGEKKLPVYKMPHLEGWAIAGNYAFVPAVGQHKVLVIDLNSWQQVGSIDVHGQPVFVMARPDGRQVWVNFAFPNNDTLQVIDVEAQQVAHTLVPGKGVLHMEFTPRGEHLWVSVRDLNRVNIYDTTTFEVLEQFSAESPSGIFFTSRAHRIGL